MSFLEGEKCWCGKTAVYRYSETSLFVYPTKLVDFYLCYYHQPLYETKCVRYPNFGDFRGVVSGS
jgi:hypothetical protein